MLSRSCPSGVGGILSETHVKRGPRIVHGDKELHERLGRNDPCPCGSGLLFKKCCRNTGCFRWRGAGPLRAVIVALVLIVVVERDRPATVIGSREMPFEVKINGIPAGYSLKGARQGELCHLVVREFTSSEDGDLFISRLEGLPSELIGLLPPENRILCSMVDNFLAIVRRDQSATLYVNELPIRLGVRAKRAVQAGQAILADDIAAVEEFGFVGVDIPPDAGVVYLFSQGWRKGLYYDLDPLHGESATPRDYDFGRMMVQHYAYLGFQYLFKITDDEWDRMIAQGWFPFISLRQATTKDLIGHLRSGFDLDDLTERVAGEFGTLLPAKLDAWKTNPFFEPHFGAFEKAVEEHLRGEYISSTSILFPRLEGLMRTYHLTVNNPVKPNSHNLVASVTDGSEAAGNVYSLFLPKNFRRFLNEVYFAGFDPRNPVGLSRNTVSHGVAPLEDFTLKGSLIGLLILDQLFFYMRPQDTRCEELGS